MSGENKTMAAKVYGAKGLKGIVRVSVHTQYSTSRIMMIASPLHNQYVVFDVLGVGDLVKRS